MFFYKIISGPVKPFMQIKFVLAMEKNNKLKNNLKHCQTGMQF